ncbi:MAG: hypothetical protein ACT4OI_03810 [Methanobacteriota archaeon]
MIPFSLRVPPRTGREDSGTRLLRDYVRWEYGGDPEWFFARRIFAPRRAAFERLRAWLRRTRIPHASPDVEDARAGVGR